MRFDSPRGMEAENINVDNGNNCNVNSNNVDNVQNLTSENSAQSQPITYSIPGILHFIQHEWSKVKIERSQWEVDRAELEARIAFLNGERKGQENLKKDLVRRVKMLEYALKQERAKYNKLKYGSDAYSEVIEPPVQDQSTFDSLDQYNSVTNVNWRQGRQVLRQYLQEFGYTDTIIDVRSNRVRSLLGVSSTSSENQIQEKPIMQNNINGVSEQIKNANTVRGSSGSVGRGGCNNNKTTLGEELLMNTEDAVMANFDFLSSEADVDDDDDDDDEIGTDEDDGKFKGQIKISKGKLIIGGICADELIDSPLESANIEVDNQFKFIPTVDTSSCDVTDSGISPEDVVAEPRTELSVSGEETTSEWVMPPSVIRYPSISSQRTSLAPTGITDFDKSETDDRLAVSGIAGVHLELGELEQLTVCNENESAYDAGTTSKEPFRKTWNAKYTLRSHFDGVRALAFHPTEPLLITASEDQTLKLWNLLKTIPAKKTAAVDVEPVYTFRGHVGAILCLVVDPSGQYIYSGGVDASIRCWRMPEASIDPYDSYDPGVLICTLLGHTDSVWRLAHHEEKSRLLSASADGTVKLWMTSDSNSDSICLKTYTGQNIDWDQPTCVNWVRNAINDSFVVGYRSGHCVIFDCESGSALIRLETIQDGQSGSLSCVTCVVSHPTFPITVTGHENRQIQFFDNSTGKLCSSMMAHLEAVTCLAIDSSGLYLISGSEDCSLRLWNFEAKTCVQEITAHRKKFDESIFDVGFHPVQPFIASAGADALAKVYV